MKLADKLEKIRNDFEDGDTPRDVVDVLNGNIEKLLSENVANLALQAGDRAGLEMPVLYQNHRSPLRDFQGAKYLILNWFRGNW